MNKEQAIALGASIRAAREEAGISLRRLAAMVDVPRSWQAYLESGRGLDPAPDRVTKIVEVLKMDPAAVDRITGDYLASSLPSVRTYFRSKGRASKAELDEIEQVVAEVRAKYGRAGNLGGRQ